MNNDSKLELALILYSQKDFPRCEQSLKDLLNLDPECGVAMAYLGRIAAQANQLESALEWFSKAVGMVDTKDDAEIHFELGCFLELCAKDTAGLRKALNSYEQATSLDINHHKAFFNKANIHKRLNEWEQALKAYNSAIFINSSNSYYYNNRGDLLLTLRSFPYAEKDFLAAIEFDPGISYFYDNAGNVYKELKRFEESKVQYKRSLAVDPQNALTYNNMGNLFLDQEEWEKALACYEMALRMKPIFYQALYNKGLLYQRFNLFAQALKCYEQALQINPDSSEVLWNITIIELTCGDLDSGLLGYQRRWSLPENKGLYFQTTKPELSTGVDCSSVLIWAEHGLGNEIFWTSFLRHPKFLGKELILKVDPRLHQLFGAAFEGRGNVRFIKEFTELSDNDFEAHLPMGSLLHYLDITNSNIKDKTYTAQFSSAYLREYDPSQVTQIRSDLRVDAKKEILVGVAWKSVNQKTGTRRSIPLSLLMTVFKDLPIKCVSLQYGDVKEDLDELNSSYDLETQDSEKLAQTNVKVHQCERIDNFADMNGLSNLIKACDMVICIDNSVLHLASAMGKPTCALLPFVADWRWFTDQELSPWYKHTKLYRQKKWGNWDAPLSLLRDDLERAMAFRFED